MAISIGPKSEVASVDVHTQKSFTPLCPNELPVPEGHLIATELNQQAELASHRIGSKEAHHPKALWVADDSHPQLSPVSGDNVDVYWAAHSIVGTEGFNLIDGLPAITEYDYFIWEGIELDMHPYGICYHDQAEKLSTGVIEYLKQHQIKTVIVGGLATDYCVKVSAHQLVRAGFRVIINLGACRGLDVETTQLAIEEMQAAGIECIKNASELMNQ